MSQGNVWSGLGDAPTFERGTFFNPGSIHDVQVNRCLLKKSQKTNKLGLIVETDILTSGPTGEINPKTNQPWIPLPAGSQGTWWQDLSDPKVAMPAVKGFVFAILGLEPGDPRRGLLEQIVPGSENWPMNQTRRPFALIESLMIWATEEANILAGQIVHLDTKLIRTEKRGLDFTIHNWNPINYQAMGLTLPDVDRIFAQCRTPPPMAAPAQNQGWGAPQGPPPGYGAQPYGPPQGQGWGQPPPGYGPPAAPAWNQGPPPGQPPGQSWGSPPPDPRQYQNQPPPYQGPPPGYGPPAAAPPGYGQPPPWRR